MPLAETALLAPGEQEGRGVGAACLTPLGGLSVSRATAAVAGGKDDR